MPSVTFVKPFRFSPDGIAVEEYPLGKHSVSDRCAEVAREAGVLKATRSRVAPETAAASTAPETM